MPHLHLEYSSNLPDRVASRDLMRAFHAVLADHGVSVGNCKSRAEERRVFLVGDGSPEESFVHLDVRLLEGRTPETKRSIGDALLAILVDAYQQARPNPQITVEVRDIERAGYFKHPPGTI
jgi:5-carboxymethyl-2-hydroxymuconate isomerase